MDIWNTANSLFQWLLVLRFSSPRYRVSLRQFYWYQSTFPMFSNWRMNRTICGHCGFSDMSIIARYALKFSQISFASFSRPSFYNDLISIHKYVCASIHRQIFVISKSMLSSSGNLQNSPQGTRDLRYLLAVHKMCDMFSLFQLCLLPHYKERKQQHISIKQEKQNS